MFFREKTKLEILNEELKRLHTHLGCFSFKSGIDPHDCPTISLFKELLQEIAKINTAILNEKKDS